MKEELIKLANPSTPSILLRINALRIKEAVIKPFDYI
jgi:hypothetical protein